MQSTGQASTQAVSLVPMHGSAITYAIAVPQAPRNITAGGRNTTRRGREFKTVLLTCWLNGPAKGGSAASPTAFNPTRMGGTRCAAGGAGDDCVCEQRWQWIHQRR